MIENSKSNKFWIEYFSKSYEQFMGVSTTNIKLKIYTLEEQMAKYACNLAYWYIQLEMTDGNEKTKKHKHIEPKETFIKAQIRKLYDTIQNIFPPFVAPEIDRMKLKMKHWMKLETIKTHYFII